MTPRRTLNLEEKTTTTRTVTVERQDGNGLSVSHIEVSNFGSYEEPRLSVSRISLLPWTLAEFEQFADDVRSAFAEYERGFLAK